MGPISYTRFAVVSAFALGAGIASAQDVGSYQLPPSPRPSATAQGPVVPDVPPPRPASTPTTTPTPTPSASPTPEAEPRIVLPTAPRPSSTPTRPAPAATVAAPPAQADPVPAASPTIAAVPSSAPLAIPPAIPPAPTAIQPEPESGSNWPWLAAALALIAAAGGYAVFRRRQRGADAEPVFEPPVVRRDPLPEIVPPIAPAIAPTIAPLITPTIAPKPNAPAPALTVDLEAARMSATLFNATLAYRLTVSASTAIDSLTVRGDMTAAHSSRPAEEQLGSGDAPVLHRAGQLAAGEPLELLGEIRLPLAAITPIQHGSAALFVPLVRLELEAMADGKPVRLRAAFVVGLEERGSDERLHPFRLDLGPRNYPYVGRRALTVPTFA